jgi:hypothetical protein
MGLSSSCTPFDDGETDGIAIVISTFLPAEE